MGFEKFFAIVVNGVETNKASTEELAIAKADRLRKVHGTYNVWIRPHALLVA